MTHHNEQEVQSDAPSTLYDDLLAEAGLTDADVCEIYGFSSRAPKLWREMGRAPRVICQALIHYAAAKRMWERNRPTFIVVGQLHPHVTPAALEQILPVVFAEHHCQRAAR